MLIFSFGVAAVEKNIDDQKNTIVIEYMLDLNFDRKKQKIITKLHNLSLVDLHIRQDSLPSSIFFRGVRMFAYEDSERLQNIPLALPVGSNPEPISIPAGTYIEGEISLTGIMRGHCDVLEKSPILIFWNYSTKSENFVLFPKEGVFRISHEDVIC